MMINILLTSAGRRSYIVDYFKSCIGIGKVHASNSEYSIALQRADAYFISPLIYDEDYIPSLVRYCKSNSISAVLSLFDIDLLVLAKNCQAFDEAGIKLILASAEFVEICNDKWLTYQFLISHGLRSPKTFLNIDDVKVAVENNEISYPVLLKPRWGMASRGIYIAENEQELEILSRVCNRDIFRSYLKYESSMTANEAIVYQEVMNGEEYGLDVINDLDGNYVGTFAKQKLAMRSGETDLGLTANSAPFEDIAKSIAAYSKHEGILSIDCFKNKDGIHIIEMNCRISGHYPLAHLAGVNYPQQIIDWLAGKPTNSDLFKFETGLYIVKDLNPVILRKG